MPLSDAELGKFESKTLHFPTLVGAVVPIYNVPGINRELNFSGEALAGILLGKITTPSTPIKVAHRGDGSGTTFVLTHFLSQVSEPWKAKIGEGRSVHWPVGEAATGSEGVAESVAKTAGAIGFVELNYAIKQKLTHGAVRNQAGEFQKATFETVSAAVDSVQVPEDFRVVATHVSGKGEYPLASFTYLIVPQHYDAAPKREAMKRFLTWVLTAGQKSALALDYNILQPPILDKVTSQIDRIH